MTKDRSIILTIREYENSVDMPDAERVTYLDPRPTRRSARNTCASVTRWMLSPAGISPAPAQ